MHGPARRVGLLPLLRLVIGRRTPLAVPPCAGPNGIAGTANYALKGLTEVRMAAASSFCFLSWPVHRCHGLEAGVSVSRIL